MAAAVSLVGTLFGPDMVTVRAAELAIISVFNELPEASKRMLVSELAEGVHMIAIAKDQSLRFSLWCRSLEALIVLRLLLDSGELKPMMELLLNKLLTDTPQSHPVHLQHLYLIDYCKAQQYCFDHLHDGKQCYP